MKTFRSIIVCALLIIINNNSYSQGNSNDSDTTLYVAADKYPVLIADKNTYEIDELQDFIKQNLKYPKTGPDCVGSVFISIVIEKDGTVSKKEFARKLCAGYDENAMRVVEYMTKWKPAIKNDKPVRFKMMIPIKWI
jgi:hypothetical protein